jgi:hypothetical protein
MANCKEWQELDNKEKIQLVGKCVHLLQNDSAAFQAMSSMVRNAEQRGCLEDVVILTEHSTEKY